MHYRFLTVFLLLAFYNVAAISQVDDTRACIENLAAERARMSAKLVSATGEQRIASLRRMLDLGQWDEVRKTIDEGRSLNSDDRSCLVARLLILNNDFRNANDTIRKILARYPAHTGANKLKITLLTEAWRLDEAAALARKTMDRNRDDLECGLLLGRILLLQQKYNEAETLIAALHGRFPNNASVYRLEADLRFWNLQPEQAEPLLVKSLTLDPFNADARFSYGYALWRRIDTALLDSMAAQWEVALALNPLHFSTHWHWGNGHTNLTYANYADPDEDVIRAVLEPADSLFSAGNTAAAVELTRRVEAEYPASVLPLMHRASLWYSDFDNPDRSANLDSAQTLFCEILKRKHHYGPAHNGLSAVIKSKRIPWLSRYDSITARLRNTRIDDEATFEQVFPDAGYYPGNLAKSMVWNQLNSSVAYFPFLIKQHHQFVVPPLHKDLAVAMNDPEFRTITTFDNRQWMDIRGVGNGAAAIEYVERGAYEERNVLLHEYVHLFHMEVLTDAQCRRIRELYLNAMANNLTLDYYSQNNEHEYLAQTYPAYFEAEKVHPLDFKSMNTTQALKTKDPAMYAFLDSLVKKERHCLEGDANAMADNWAQVYVNLSRRQRENPQLASLLLDTAIMYLPYYQPAWLAKARLQMRQKLFDEALVSIRSSERINPSYAPNLTARAELIRLSEPDSAKSLTAQSILLHQAMNIETDLQNRYAIARMLSQLYVEHGKIDEALDVAEEYIRNGSEISTYLRDCKAAFRKFVEEISSKEK